MRLFRTAKIAVAMAVLLAFFSFAPALSGVCAGQDNPYLYPSSVGRTCSGSVAGPGIETHVFGFRGPGSKCSTRVFHANNYSEALECARAACPDCDSIEEITGTVKFGSAVEGLELLKGYCLEK